MKEKTIRGELLLLLTAMIWGAAFAAQRAGMDSIEPFSFCAARMALSALVVGAVVIARRRTKHAPRREEEKAKRRNTLLGGLCCGLFLGAASLFQQAGLRYTTAGKAGFITSLYMLLVPVLGLALLRKKHGALVWSAVGLGVAGLYLLCVSESLRLARGDALVCVCALLFAGHILCCGLFSARGDALAISALQFAVAALLSAAAAAVFERPAAGNFLSAALPILYCGVLSGGVGYTLQMIAQRDTEPTVAALLMSLEAVFAVLSGALLLGERMSGRELLGCAAMLAAVILLQLPRGRIKRENN